VAESKDEQGLVAACFDCNICLDRGETRFPRRIFSCTYSLANQSALSGGQKGHMKLFGLLASSVLLCVIVVASLKPRKNKSKAVRDFEKWQRRGIDRHEWYGCDM
jgi:hypothetical protein|tara:strand:- start:123 stop:437 length:315 start_codon:yes stop_codon:yes gene_type:complete